MKIKYISIIISVVSIFLIVIATIFLSADSTAQEPPFNDLHVCSMHPWVASDGPSDCDLCGMKLSQVHGHKAGTKLPEIENLFVSVSDPNYIHEGPGKDPNDGTKLINITESPFYTPMESSESMEMSMEEPQQTHGDASMVSMDTDEGTQLWTCGMHPEVIQDEPGICPICHMDLIPLKKGSATGTSEIIIDPVTMQNIGVVTEEVKLRNLSVNITTDGVIQIAEDSEYRINTRISGWIEKLYADKTGDWISKGQLLYQIYSPELVAAQREFIIAVEDGSDDMKKAARQRLELWNISAEQIDALETGKIVLNSLKMYAPASGVLIKKNIVEGGYVKTGTDLYTIFDMRNVWVKASVYEFELPWIEEGDNVAVKSPYDADLSASGKIEYIQPVIDSKTRSAELRIPLKNPGLKFKQDMYVDIEIITAPKKNAVSVPKEAVIRSGRRDIVFIAKGGGIFEPREVHLGIETEYYYEILHNLSAGETVVTSGQFLLDSEAKLQEAIQKRLQMRKKMNSGDMEVDDTMIQDGGHRH